MKKVKKIIWLSITMSIVLVCLNGCWKKIHMDEEKCAEVALEYMKSKYGKEFILVDSSERMKINGPAGFAEVEVKTTESEDSYWVTVYPDKKSDKDKDGYYDSYKVVLDDYMCLLIEDYAKSSMTELLSDSGLMIFNCKVDIHSKGYAGGWGIVAEFPVPDKNTFSMKNVLNNYSMSTYCWIDIPKSEYNDMLQENIEKIVKPLVLKGYIKFIINIYSDEDYKAITERDNSNTKNDIIEKEEFEFIINSKED